LSGPRYHDVAERRRFADEVVNRMQTVHHGAFGLSTGSDQMIVVRKEGAPALRPDQPRAGASLNATSSGYAKAMGLVFSAGAGSPTTSPCRCS
jgi:hypothetical protein